MQRFATGAHRLPDRSSTNANKATVSVLYWYGKLSKKEFLERFQFFDFGFRPGQRAWTAPQGQAVSRHATRRRCRGFEKKRKTERATKPKTKQTVPRPATQGQRACLRRLDQCRRIQQHGSALPLTHEDHRASTETASPRVCTGTSPVTAEKAIYRDPGLGSQISFLVWLRVAAP